MQPHIKSEQDIASRASFSNLHGRCSRNLTRVTFSYNNSQSFSESQMYKVEILSDKLEQEAIARRRRLDEERKERIFNPKLRVLGVGIRCLSSCR
jgi:hypothetical protein